LKLAEEPSTILRRPPDLRRLKDMKRYEANLIRAYHCAAFAATERVGSG
jgi:hypothetical protein